MGGKQEAYPVKNMVIVPKDLWFYFAQLTNNNDNPSIHVPKI